jgi:hypothetical protein
MTRTERYAMLARIALNRLARYTVADPALWFALACVVALLAL